LPRLDVAVTSHTLDSICRRVGARIRRARTNKGLSQEQLALEAGLHRAYVGQIERGEKNIGISNLARIAKALGLSLAELLAGIQ
jgi:transcriptional regulator with XRE-family HTH domain